MTHKERVAAAIAHRHPDRTPRGELGYGNDIVRRLIGAERFASLSPNERTLAVIRELGADLVDVHQFPIVRVGETPSGSVFRSVLGEEHVIVNGSSALHKPAFQDIEQARDFPEIDPATCLTDNLDWFLANSDLYVFAQVMGPVSALDWMLGTEDFMIWAMTETEVIRDVVEKVIAYEIARACIFVDHGAEAIFVADDIAFNTGLFLPPRIMDALAWPFYKKMIAAVKARRDVPVFLHTDGDIRKALAEIAACGFDGLHSLQPSAGVDIDAVKRDYGDRLCLMGNMDLNHLMPFGTPAEVAQEARRLCREIGHDGGHILATCNVMTDAVPAENARAMYAVQTKKDGGA